VYVYYQLENFYQNHRRYVKSRSSDQLQGTSGISNNDLKSDCDPLYQNGSLTLSPCGLIANSLFNGKSLSCFYFLPLPLSFSLARVQLFLASLIPVFLLPSSLLFSSFSGSTVDIIVLASDSLASGPTNITLDEGGISWQSDRDVKFKNVDGFAVLVVDPATFAAWGTDAAATCTANGLESGKLTYMSVMSCLVCPITFVCKSFDRPSWLCLLNYFGSICLTISDIIDKSFHFSLSISLSLHL
jgi:hypothetical protein